MKTFLPTEVRNRWKQVLQEVSNGEEILVHLGSDREIVMLPKDLYESLLGTIETLSDPAAMQAIRKHRKGRKRTYTLQDIDRLIES